MHFISGIIGVIFVFATLLFWQSPWLAGVYPCCAILSLLAIRPLMKKWWLYVCGVSAAVCAIFLFFVFLVGASSFFFTFFTVAAWPSNNAIASYELVVLLSGFAMTFIVCEYCCWLKGRQELIKLKIPLQKSRERPDLVAVSRSQ